MIKKNSIVAAVICLLLLPACGKTEGGKTRHAPVAAKLSAKANAVHRPDYRGLIEEYHAILKQDPHNLAAIIGLGNAHFDSGDWKNANIMYAYALLIDPKNADVRTDMGTAYRNRGMIDKALAEYRTALKDEPDHLNARYNMGVVYAYNKKEYQEAVRIWEDLLNRAPGYPQADKIRAMISAIKRERKRDAR